VRVPFERRPTWSPANPRRISSLCPAIPREPPKGTPFDSNCGQVMLLPHFKGIELEWRMESSKLLLVHDGDFEVVTDTLPGRYEDPYDADHKTQPMSIRVERPVFAPHRSEVAWPLEGRSLLVPWTGSPPPRGGIRRSQPRVTITRQQRASSWHCERRRRTLPGRIPRPTM
jgi:hypothetical protein